MSKEFAYHFFHFTAQAFKHDPELKLTLLNQLGLDALNNDAFNAFLKFASKGHGRAFIYWKQEALLHWGLPIPMAHDFLVSGFTTHPIDPYFIQFDRQIVTENRIPKIQYLSTQHFSFTKEHFNLLKFKGEYDNPPLFNEDYFIDNPQKFPITSATDHAALESFGKNQLVPFLNSIDFQTCIDQVPNQKLIEVSKDTQFGQLKLNYRKNIISMA